MTSAPGDEVRDNAAAGRYEIVTPDGTAFLAYRRSDRAIILVHTEVPGSLRGRNLANSLARHALDTAREAGLRVVPKCPFVSAYIRRHPEYADLTRAIP